jgi:hypothetical protein
MPTFFCPSTVFAKISQRDMLLSIIKTKINAKFHNMFNDRNGHRSDQQNYEARSEKSFWNPMRLQTIPALLLTVLRAKILTLSTFCGNAIGTFSVAFEPKMKHV